MRDLFANRTRTVLVVLSIAVGVFAVGAVQSSQNILTREMNRTWNSTRPASARLSLSAFEQDFVESIQRMPEIVATEGRRSAWARTTSGQETKQIELVGIRDFDDIHVGAIFPEQVSPGTWPPPKRQILLERNSLWPMHRYGWIGFMELAHRSQRHCASSMICGLTGRAFIKQLFHIARNRIGRRCVWINLTPAPLLIKQVRLCRM